jgi:hypothetical protein
MVMRVSWQFAIGQVDAAAIKEFAARGDRDEHRRVTVLGDANARSSLRSSSRHAFLPIAWKH